MTELDIVDYVTAEQMAYHRFGLDCETVSFKRDGSIAGEWPSPARQWKLRRLREHWRLDITSADRKIAYLTRVDGKWRGFTTGKRHEVELLRRSEAKPSSLVMTSPLPTRTVVIDREKLVPGELHGNCSIIRRNDQWLLAYRVGCGDSRFALAGLDSEFRPVWNHKPKLNLLTPNVQGIEDPRLFDFKGALYCAFSVKSGGRFSQWVGRLDDNLDCPRPSYLRPHIPGRHEKNW